MVSSRNKILENKKLLYSKIPMSVPKFLSTLYNYQIDDNKATTKDAMSNRVTSR